MSAAVTNLVIELDYRDALDVQITQGRKPYLKDLILRTEGVAVYIPEEHFPAIFEAIAPVLPRPDDGWVHPSHLDGVRIATWVSGIDDARVVQIDTEPDVGRVRINLNEGHVWDGNPER